MLWSSYIFCGQFFELQTHAYIFCWPHIYFLVNNTYFVINHTPIFGSTICHLLLSAKYFLVNHTPIIAFKKVNHTYIFWSLTHILCGKPNMNNCVQKDWVLQGGILDPTYSDIIFCGQPHNFFVVNNLHILWSNTHLFCSQPNIYFVINQRHILWSTKHLFGGQHK